MAVLAEKLRKEVEENGLLPLNQTGFRKRLGTMDNIYALNYLINRQIDRGKGKMIILFVDLKAAFDSVDRGLLTETIKRRGVREDLIKKCEEALRETVNRVKEGEKFWTVREVRQRCPLSPCLFTLMLADVDEKLEKGEWGGIRLKKRKIYTLAYADDIALLADDEENLKEMMERLEKYLDRKSLEL